MSPPPSISPPAGFRRGTARRRSAFPLWIVLGVVALGGILLLVLRAEPFAPTATLETPIDTVGHATAIRVAAHDRGSGLARVEVRLVPGGGGNPAIVASAVYPAIHWGWSRSGVNDTVLTTTVDAAAAGLPEGPATLQVFASDHSWLAGFRHAPLLTRPVTVDLTPPTLELVAGPHVARIGGSECLVYRVSADATESGVEVGGEVFPGDSGVFKDAGLRAVLFAVPQDMTQTRTVAFATDAAGNRRRAEVDVTAKPRTFAEKTLPLSEEFLRRKVPELLEANGLPAGNDLVAGYLRINREVRAASEKRIREACRQSTPVPLWEGAFLRMPNSAPLSGFADRRTYLYEGQPIDHQTHLGFDLASLRGSIVPAGNTGKVAFTGPLGIYGNTVILDHGLGLFSLYGHLSEITVTTGARVARGDPIGKTGDTGLAGGDHLHFSIMIHGVHVDPVEWWDAHWIHDHVEARLDAFPRAEASP